MGATFAVHLAQAASLAVLQRMWLRNPPLMRDSTDLRVRDGEGTALAYIDDMTVVGTDREGVNSATRRVMQQLKEANFPGKESKTLWADEVHPGETLGLWW